MDQPFTRNANAGSSAQGGRWVWVGDDAPHPGSTPQQRSQDRLLPSSLPQPERIPQTTQTQPTVDLSDIITEEEVRRVVRVDSGGFADVYVLRHDVLGVVAMQRIRESGDKDTITAGRKRAKWDAQLWKQCEHISVLRLLGFYESPQHFFLISPYCINGTIVNYLKSNPRADRLTLLVEAAEGVDYIHRNGLIHGNIKGSNILISDTGHALVTGSGFARLSNEVTSSGLSGVGSTRWMSPELLSGEPKTRASDIWAIGMTIAEVLSGNVPFHNRTTELTVVMALTIKNERPAPYPSTSPTGESYDAAWDYASSCWDSEPTARPSLALARKSFAPSPPTYAVLEIRSGATGTPTVAVKFYLEELYHARLIGAGGFGEVFTLVKEEMGQVALKRLRGAGDEAELRESRRRARREGEIWLQLSHPNILKLVGILETREHFYFVSPFMQNGALPGFLKRNPMINRLRLIAEAVAGILHLHEQGIIHGDIKAGNVLIDDEGHAQVHDFSLSRLTESQTSVAAHGGGSLRWQSPELIRLGHGKTLKSDVWAFGMFIYEVLSGEIPFKDMNNYAVLIAMMQGYITPRPQPESSPMGRSYTAIWEIALECWRENPEERLSMETIYNRLATNLS